MGKKRDETERGPGSAQAALHRLLWCDSIRYAIAFVGSRCHRGPLLVNDLRAGSLHCVLAAFRGS